MMPRLFALALAGLVALALPADAQRSMKREPRPTGPAEEAVPQKQPKTFPLGAQWLAVSLNGKPLGRERPTLQIDQQLRARGFGGCNTFSATAYPLQGQKLAVGPIALSRKGCDKALMDQERAFLVAFRTSQAWDLKEGYLVLMGQAGELRFERSL